jgi:hypothetical protein
MRAQYSKGQLHRAAIRNAQEAQAATVKMEACAVMLEIAAKRIAADTGLEVERVLNDIGKEYEELRSKAAVMIEEAQSVGTE